MIIFDVVTTEPCSTLIFNSLKISVRRLLEDMLDFSFYLVIFFHILTNTKLKHVTSTYYHSQYLVFEFTLNVTYFHRIIDNYFIKLNILFSVVGKLHKKDP